MNKELVNDIEKHIGYLDIVLKNHTTTTEAIFRKCDAEELKDVLEKCLTLACENEIEEIKEITKPIEIELEIVDVVKRVLNLDYVEFEDTFGHDVNIVDIFDTYTINGIKAMLDAPKKPFHKGDIVLYYGEPHVFLQTNLDENASYLLDQDLKLVRVDLQTVGGCSMEKYKGSTRAYKFFKDTGGELKHLKNCISKGENN